MPLIEINRDPTPRQIRQFATLWLSGFCFLLAGLAVVRYGSWTAAVVLAGCGAASIALGIARPAWMRLVMLAWMWAAFPIGWIVSHVLVAVVYYLVVTPVGLAMRALGRDPLSRRFDPAAESYWVPRRQEADRRRYFRQF
jgi:Saxitoxin biosynthesis operon protein SxtJ